MVAVRKLGDGSLTSWGKLTWAPPTLATPTTVYLSNSATGRKTGILDPTKDYIVVVTEEITVSDGIEVNGGRNIRLVGASVNFGVTNYGTTYGNRGMFIKGHPSQTVARTIHIEGVNFAGYMTEGINYDGQGEPGATLVLQNVNFSSPVIGAQPTNHADLFQCYNGPTNLRVDHFYGKTQYQGFMIQPHQFPHPTNTSYYSPLGTYDFRNVYIESTTDAGVSLYMVTGASNGSDRPTVVTSEVYLKPPPSKSYPTQVLLENPAFWGTGVHYAPFGAQKPISSLPGTNYVTPGYTS